jgi:PAS domain S-box-containing protein
MNAEQIDWSEQETQARTRVDTEGNFIEVNEKAVELFGYSEKELLEMDCSEVLANPSWENGIEFKRLLSGSENYTQMKILRKDGTIALVAFKTFPSLTEDGRVLESKAKIIEELSSDPIQEPDDSNPEEIQFEGISDEELSEIVENIRVDAPEGEIPLNAIMMDIAVGHNELEQYKTGALSTYEAVDSRLKEEQERNPDSKECQVLQEVKKSAFGLYLRVQRGDEELHGNRDGRYSGYFN